MTTRRVSVPNYQRAALRHHYHSTTGKPTHTELITWFQAQFGHEISQSIVSRSLSDRFKHLDSLSPVNLVLSRTRERECKWPEIEAALSQWLHAIQVQGGTVSNEIIGRKAGMLWDESEKTRGETKPKFSTGWVNKFRKRLRAQSCFLPQNNSVYLGVDLLLEYHSRPSASSAPDSNLLTVPPESQPTASTSVLDDISCTPKESFTFPLSSDHLLHLIHHNALRGLLTNKSLLHNTTLLTKALYSMISIKQTNTSICDGLSVIRPIQGQALPESLHPTLLQMNCPHSSCLNMFPVAKFRDNLIKRGTDFDLEDLFLDLWGDILPVSPEPTQGGTTKSSPLSSDLSEWLFDGYNNDEDDEDGLTAGRSCLIIWGEPWKVESWEVTPGFVRKWGWILEGCQDLILASNQWRAARGEVPLPSAV